MERPSPKQAVLGMALIVVSASGYLAKGLPDWMAIRWPSSKASAVPLTYKRFQDKQVSFELPSGWRWLAQKPDGSEADAAYFPISRFQGQNALQGSVSVRVDGIPNIKKLSADALLAVIAQGVDSKPEAIQPLKGLPKGMVGLTYPSKQGNLQTEHFVFVKPAGQLSYVLAVGAADTRFREAMALHIAHSFDVRL